MRSRNTVPQVKKRMPISVFSYRLEYSTVAFGLLFSGTHRA